jgi:ATP-binding cassette, subfamily B, heavy metal transporter
MTDDLRSPIRLLLPYLAQHKARIAVALSCLLAAKVANVMIPVTLKWIVDRMSVEKAMLAVPFALLIAYGFARLSVTLFTELREFFFAKVTQRSVVASLSSCPTNRWPHARH